MNFLIRPVSYGFLFFLAVDSQASATKLKFEELLSSIVADHPSTLKARAGLEGAKAAAQPGTFVFFPTVSASLGRSRTSLSLTSDSAALEASLNLFRGGADLASFNAAATSRDLAEAQFQSQSLQIESQSARDLLSCVEERKQLSLSEARLAAKSLVLESSRTRYSRGLVSAEELEKLELEDAQTRARHSDTIQSSQKICDKALLHGAGADMESTWPWEKLFQSPSFVERFEKLAANENPALHIARANADLARQLRVKNVGLMLPSIDLSGGYGNQRVQPSTSWTPAWSLSVGLRIPLFSQMSHYANWREAAANEIGASADLLLARRNGDEQAKSSVETLRRTSSSTLDRALMLERSRKAYQKSLELFKAGRLRVNDLSFDEERWILSQSLSVQGWLNAHLALIDFCSFRGIFLRECLAELSKN